MADVEIVIPDLRVVDDSINTNVNFILIEPRNSDDNIFIKVELLIGEKRRMIESYLRIKNSFMVPDERITEDLVVNTDVKSPEDIIYLADDVLVLETAVFQLIDVFDETDSIESLKLLIRLDWRYKREETLAKQWKKDLQLRMDL